MRGILKNVRNLNFKDMKLNNDLKYEETRLYKYLNSLDNRELEEIIIYMLTGRELSYYYGTATKISLKDYLEYFRGNKKDRSKEDMIKYIYSKKDKLNNYIDTVFRYIR